MCRLSSSVLSDLKNPEIVTLKNLTKDSAGVYRCTASNDVGEESCTVEVKMHCEWMPLPCTKPWIQSAHNLQFMIYVWRWLCYHPAVAYSHQFFPHAGFKMCALPAFTHKECLSRSSDWKAELENNSSLWLFKGALYLRPVYFVSFTRDILSIWRINWEWRLQKL